MIHPFTDGNGRVGREVLNYMLKKFDYPRLLFLGHEREDYINALKLGNIGKYQDMVNVLGNLIITQRLNIFREKLKEVILPPKKVDQLRLTDYFIL